MPRETMTPRERWLAVLQRRQPDRVPMSYRATREFTANLLRHTGHSDVRTMLAALHVDFVASVEPRYIGPPLPPNTDFYGRRYAPMHYATGAYDECVGHPLATCHSIEEIESIYTWPSPDWFDYSVIPSQVKGWETRPVHAYESEPFLIYKDLRGEEQAFTDLVLHPEIVHHCMDRLYGFDYAYAGRIFEQIPGQITMTSVSEDMGSQQSLLFSPAHIREFLLPGMKRQIDLAHSAGVYVMHHNDGDCRPILPDMVALGIDILDPVQWRAKDMDREGLKRDFGDRLVFHGAMDNQYTLPFGTMEEVRQEVLDNLRILGQGGGFILSPCHNIQPVSAPEKIVAMYETGYEYGWA
jgi:uroporphyrinogen decarboxylase